MCQESVHSPLFIVPEIQVHLMFNQFTPLPSHHIASEKLRPRYKSLARGHTALRSFNSESTVFFHNSTPAEYLLQTITPNSKSRSYLNESFMTVHFGGLKEYDHRYFLLENYVISKALM